MARPRRKAPHLPGIPRRAAAARTRPRRERARALALPATRRTANGEARHSPIRHLGLHLERLKIVVADRSTGPSRAAPGRIIRLACVSEAPRPHGTRGCARPCDRFLACRRRRYRWLRVLRPGRLAVSRSARSRAAPVSALTRGVPRGGRGGSRSGRGSRRTQGRGAGAASSSRRRRGTVP